VGWGQRLDLEPDSLQRLVVRRELPPGLYQYKFIWPAAEEVRAAWWLWPWWWLCV
jgi:hypothetical protein